MTLEPEKQNELDDALLESLLHQAYVGDAKEQERVSQVLFRLATDKSKVNRKTLLGGTAWSRWASIAFAATVLLATVYSLTLLTSPNAAYAAVMRSREVTPKTRAYRVHMVHQRRFGAIEK